MACWRPGCGIKYLQALIRASKKDLTTQPWAFNAHPWRLTPHTPLTTAPRRRNKSLNCPPTCAHVPEDDTQPAGPTRWLHRHSRHKPGPQRGKQGWKCSGDLQVLWPLSLRTLSLKSLFHSFFQESSLLWQGAWPQMPRTEQKVPSKSFSFSS